MSCNSENWIQIVFRNGDKIIMIKEYNYATADNIMKELSIIGSSGVGFSIPGRGGYSHVDCFWSHNLVENGYHKQWTLEID